MITELLKMSDHTMARLLGHLEARRKHYVTGYPERAAIVDRWIQRDIEELKVSVMTNCFDQMLWFNQEFKADEFDGGKHLAAIKEKTGMPSQRKTDYNQQK